MDIAMKFGTNYPYGPFEWANLIGLSKIAKLLEILSLKNDRYAIAPAILQELAFQNTSN
jgi:3-hydroxybutyryl-CoA dehydrogenase